MLNFLINQFEKKNLPENEFLPEEKVFYFKLMTALSQGDFNTLTTNFPHAQTEPCRILTVRFEKYLEKLEKGSPPPEVQEVLDNQLPKGAFVRKLLRS
jgi:hypothetical protein